MHYKVTFVVQAESLMDALSEAEGYLNTGDRVVDCNVAKLPEGEQSDSTTHMSLPKPAKRLR